MQALTTRLADRAELIKARKAALESSISEHQVLDMQGQQQLSCAPLQVHAAGSSRTYHALMVFASVCALIFLAQGAPI